jgi:hypothetical protein
MAGWILGLLTVLLPGCGERGGDARADVRGPVAVAVDSVRLDEADTLYLGNPYALAVDPRDGSFYVSDFFADHVFRFRRDGTLARTYGRPGRGPGEFLTPTLVFVLDERTLAAADDEHARIHLFDRETGAFLRSVPHEGRLGSSPPVVLGQTVWMPSHNRGRGSSVLAWSADGDGVRYLVPLPADYIRSARGLGRYAAFYSMGVLTAWADTLLVGMNGRNELLLADAAGRVLDTLHVPRTRRRGVPDDVRARLDEDRKASAREIFRAASILNQAARAPDGSTLLVHHDSDLHGELPGGLITARVFASVVSPDRRRACVDAEISVSQDARPIEGVRGDTIFVLDRRIAAGERLETWVIAYRLDTRRCDWLPTR